MLSDERRDELKERQSPHGLSVDEYRRLGHILVDQTADLLASIPDQKLKGSCDPETVWEALGDTAIPEQGEDAEVVLSEAVSLMSEHSLFNGHPKFWGYITSSPAPIGILGDLLASATNPNCGGWMLSPMASSMITR